MLSQFFYPYKYVELLDCLLEPQSVYRLVRRASLLFCPMLGVYYHSQTVVTCDIKQLQNMQNMF